jgi:hypothetical protein
MIPVSTYDWITFWGAVTTVSFFKTMLYYFNLLGGYYPIMSLRIVTAFIFGCLLAWFVVSNQTQSQLALKDKKISELNSIISEQADLLIRKNDAIGELNNRCGLDIQTEF